MSRVLKSLLLSIGICIFFAAVGGLLTGDALETWYPSLRQPSFALPMWGWYIVGIIYYVIVVVVLFRILNRTSQKGRRTLLMLTIAMIAGNEFWNYLLFGLKSPFIAFIGLIPFSIIVLWLYIKLRKFQPNTSWILLPYLIWLIYDFVWMYNLWKLNA